MANKQKYTLEGCNIDTHPTIQIQNTDSTAAISIHAGNLVDESDMPDQMFN
ncbi:hypothetical protein [Fructilactobacillus fructivorans]|uniref:hypothetical protein n=1 Tax=Fructilactobacillus fructivorans TaxID=1614 RepID=UPI00138F76DB|nr:hypothetical protein [Fructilactobacillus fructivorans]